MAASLGAEPVFVSPAANDLKDDLLHTGDPCPNRRGLEQLGFSGKSPEEVLELLRGAETATLFGERVAELIGHAGLDGLSSDLRTFLFDVEVPKMRSLRAAFGLANWVERSGTWVNVDGREGAIRAARPAPPGVRQPLDLARSLVPAEAAAR